MHPSIEGLLRWFRTDHMPAGVAKSTSEKCVSLAYDMASNINSNPELTAGLRKLLEAKDCFVRAAIAAEESKEA